MTQSAVPSSPAARRKARRYALQALYQWQLAGATLSDLGKALDVNPQFEQGRLQRAKHRVDFLTDGWNVGVVRSGVPAAGFAGVQARERLEDSLVFGVEDVGRGEVVYLADSPLFRGFWADGQLLFANAVFGMEAW